ncbi:MAG: putative lipid II flippase FtsW [Candidatus Omnitrophica bacterium]|nr:putative lipid II flippase FtsW [Candidatus Omnitrophota bacterium]MBD3269533.1 putative lipid II flippase FtsW [Candidatus Omnitrophota bacterium]
MICSPTISTEVIVSWVWLKNCKSLFGMKDKSKIRGFPFAGKRNPEGNARTLRRQRRGVLIIILSLTLFGLLMVYESSSIYAFKNTGDAAYFFKRQFLFFLIGLMMFSLALFIDLEFLKHHSKSILLFTLFLLFLLFFLGKESGGARRWLSLGGFNIQPSELLKVSFLIYCADYYRRKSTTLKDFRAGLLPLGFVLGIICFLLISQPDLGTAVFWVIWMIFFLFLFGARSRHLLSTIGLGSLVLFFLIRLYPYRFRRIVGYLNPFADPKGAGFQLIQSQIAYGEGGLLGVGLGEGMQKLFFLPAAHTDFIFSIVAEEFGLFGSMFFLALFFLLFHKMFKIAKQARDRFCSAILWGIILIFFLEITINLGVSCGLLPTKGLPLPFISYGGSNLVVHYMLLGLFFNASLESRTKSRKSYGFAAGYKR